MLNSSETKALPNFPKKYPDPDRAKAILYLNDGEDVVSPYIGGESGDIILKTLFKPGVDNRAFIEKFLGGPPSSISGHQQNMNSAAIGQPHGLSDVKNFSGENIPEAASSVNKKVIPVALLAAALGGDAARNASNSGVFNQEEWERMARNFVSTEPPVEEAAWSPADLLVATVGAVGIPAKLIAMALDAPS